MNTRCIVVHVYARAKRVEKNRTPEACLEEAVGLAAAINLTVIDAFSIGINHFTSATLIGSGQVNALRVSAATHEVGLLIIDHPLSPIQQSNLEKELNCKVIDRTGLILEIFGERAATREGMLQVELAALSYQRGRLVRSWTHLERQRGGFGFMGGPGERQIELDRRMIGQRIERIKADLKDVRRTRGLARQARARREQPVVALIGYTNAGKSTLFNTLTQAGVLAKDLLFATLDPTMRRIELAPGRAVMLSDTVGFISDLPTHLIEAFRATLEEVEQADVILHIRDTAHDDSDAQRADVLAVLASLGIQEDDPRIIEVLNKTDLLAEGERTVLEVAAQHRRVNGEHIVSISAISGQGIDRLVSTILEMAYSAESERTFTLHHTEGAALAWLYNHARVTNRNDGELIQITATMTERDWERFDRLELQPAAHKGRAEV